MRKLRFVRNKKQLIDFTMNLIQNMLTFSARLIDEFNLNIFIAFYKYEILSFTYYLFTIVHILNTDVASTVLRKIVLL